MKDLALYLIRKLADRPDEAAVSMWEADDAVVLRLTVAESDKGKVIGRQGKVIKAIRDILAVSADKTGKRVRVDLD